MTRKKIDLSKKPKWIQYIIALVIVAIIFVIVYSLKSEEIAKNTKFDLWFSLKTIGVGLIFILLRVLLFRRKK